MGVIGWREWIELPDLGVPSIKAKVDTGARSSALHAFDLQERTRDGRTMLCFKIKPIQRSSRGVVSAEAELVDRRHVRSSSGKRELRPVILTAVELAGQRWEIELTLTRRDAMGFRMLLGRQALRGRFLVDPGRSYIRGKRNAKKRSKERGRKRRGRKGRGARGPRDQRLDEEE